MTEDRAAVAANARAILDAEGPYHVEGRYIADAMLAERERLRAAERRAREQVRRSGFIERAA